MLLLSRSSIGIMLNGMMLHHWNGSKLKLVAWNSIAIHICVQESLILH